MASKIRDIVMSAQKDKKMFFSNRIIKALNKEQCQYILNHLEQYKGQKNLESKINKRFDEFALPGYEERFEALVADPGKLPKRTTENLPQYLALLEQKRIAELDKINKEKSDELLAQELREGITSKERFEFKKGRFTKKGNFVIEWSDQLNSNPGLGMGKKSVL